MKLAIVVGHDINQPGAMSAAPLNKHEYDYNLEVAEFIYRIAMQNGITTKIFLRNKIGVTGVYKLVTEWSDDDTVCVELHFNSFDKKSQGTETLFDSDPTESVDLAREIHQQVCSVFSRKGKMDRGLKLSDEGRGSHNLTSFTKPSCLIEPFFGDNPADADLGLKLKMQYAEAIVKGVAKFFINRDKNMSLN